MNIFVLLKRTFDTEENIVIANDTIDDSNAEFIINPYDEYAVEEAVSLRDEHGGEVTVVTADDEEAEKQLRTALAMGADRAVLIETDDLDEIDSSSIAFLLASYLKAQDYDLIIGGNISVDNGSGQVGPSIAEHLGIPQVTTITKITVEDGKATLVRDVEGDEETIEASLPLLVTAQQGLNEPRYPSLPGIMKAKKKPIETLDLDDLSIDEDDAEAKTEVTDISLPPPKSTGIILEGDAKDVVTQLISNLKEKENIL